MQLENITYEDSKFNLIPNRYQDTNAIAIMIQEVGEDYCEPITVDCVLDPEIKEEDEIEGDLVAILADETELVGTLFEYGLIKAREWVPDLVISNQQFSYNNKLYQLLVIDQPMY